MRGRGLRPMHGVIVAIGVAACVTTTRKNSKHPKCIRLVSLSGKLIRAAASGANHFTFNGKIGSHKLGRGTYELIAVPAGGAPRNVTFTIVP